MNCEICKKKLVKFGNIMLHPPSEDGKICQERDGILIVIEDEALHKIFQDKYKEVKWDKKIFWKFWQKTQ